ncbi:hypothetical protein [Plesiomonas sp. PI-19]|uniref:hypothetical protein n=1 Tax=Plesiomonas sp. PI-19 TaxID=2898798 RepID=UPI001F33AB73|nr:hypothetical protein [Plesiomonas sp. PI-19]MCE5163765.1 hypothetical protein [Plesiomonas sp. PI-19]
MSEIIVSSNPIPTTKRVWVIRSGKNAAYYQHFRKNGIVAIGHIADLNVGNISGELSLNDKNKILGLYKTSLIEEGEESAVVSRQTGQVYQFLNVVKEGDTVLTITDSVVLAGIVKSKCYYDKTGLRSSVNDSTDDNVCYFPLRIKVEWGHTHARQHIPYVIDRSFRNTGTIFSISDEEKINVINHWLQPIHFVENEVRCSISINSHDALSNRALSSLSHVYDELELLANFLSSTDDLNSLTKDDFINFIRDNSSEFQYQLTAQHAFMSPGFQFIQLKGDKTVLKVFAICICLLFNNQVVFAEENENNPELTKKAMELVQVVKTSKIENSIDSLDAEMQKQAYKIVDTDDIDISFEKPTPSTDAML